jgi:hypothetical protein
MITMKHSISTLLRTALSLSVVAAAFPTSAAAQAYTRAAGASASASAASVSAAAAAVTRVSLPASTVSFMAPAALIAPSVVVSAPAGAFAAGVSAAPSVNAAPASPSAATPAAARPAALSADAAPSAKPGAVGSLVSVAKPEAGAASAAPSASRWNRFFDGLVGRKGAAADPSAVAAAPFAPAASGLAAASAGSAKTRANVPAPEPISKADAKFDEIGDRVAPIWYGGLALTAGAFAGSLFLSLSPLVVVLPMALAGLVVLLKASSDRGFAADTRRLLGITSESAQRSAYNRTLAGAGLIVLSGAVWYVASAGAATFVAAPLVLLGDTLLVKSRNEAAQSAKLGKESVDAQDLDRSEAARVGSEAAEDSSRKYAAGGLITLGAAIAIGFAAPALISLASFGAVFGAGAAVMVYVAFNVDRYVRTPDAKVPSKSSTAKKAAIGVGVALALGAAAALFLMPGAAVAFPVTAAAAAHTPALALPLSLLAGLFGVIAGGGFGWYQDKRSNQELGTAIFKIFRNAAIGAVILGGGAALALFGIPALALPGVGALLTATYVGVAAIAGAVAGGLYGVYQDNHSNQDLNTAVLKIIRNAAIGAVAAGAAALLLIPGAALT